MRVINIIKDVQPIRMGVWTAATNTASHLQNKYNVISELWFPGSDHGHVFNSVESVSLRGCTGFFLKKIIRERNLQPHLDIIVTHSPWSYQSHWGSYLAQRGFKWIFVAHGILQSTHVSQKWLKKKIYFELFERKLLSRVNTIRAISTPEKIDLKKKFPGKKIVLIPNGSELSSAKQEKRKERVIFLYMGRLHHQKRVVQLVQAWLMSSLNNKSSYELIIAGPDDGEFIKLSSLLKQSSNARYIGPIYNTAKEEWISKSSFFILPSIGEGFPVSVVEAAGRGLIPVITDGCNFPEIIKNGLAIKTGKEPDDIRSSLDFCAGLDECKRQKMSNDLIHFMKNNYSVEIIAQKQYELYKGLLQDAN